MINHRKILQLHFIYFRKICYIVCNLKKKIELSPPLLNPQSKHTLRISGESELTYHLKYER